MDHKDKIARLKQMLQQVAPEGSLETVMPPTEGALESTGSAGGVGTPFSEEEIAKAASGLRKMQEGREDQIDMEEARGLEAIILPRERPVFFVTNGSYPTMRFPWTELNDEVVRSRLEAAIRSIGRIELPMHPRIPYGGTGFLVGDGLLMTNRHVAELFVKGLGITRLRFNRGDAAVDFRRERNTPNDSRDTFFEVVEVVMVHPYWDMALLRVAGLPGNHGKLTLSTDEPAKGAAVVAIGYPARDDRNDLAEQDRVFEGRYNVKRFQPGKMRSRERIRSFEQMVNAATHDSSTLGGNSGSAIIDPATGRVVALHFAGTYLKSNYAVPALELARDARVVAANVLFAGTVPSTNEWDDAWRRTGTMESSVAVPGQAVPSAATTIASALRRGVDNRSATFTIPLTVTVSLGSVPSALMPTPRGYRSPPPVADTGEGDDTEAVAEDYLDRIGYQPDFLGSKFVVDRPEVVRNADDVLAFEINGSQETELRYEHYSVVMSRSRRMCFLSAVNIDGTLSKKSKRVGWKWDPRLPKSQQIMHECYGDPPRFSRGHMTRREDPAWGNEATAKRGNEDSMHVTNTTPQMQAFNSPIWLALEDYALGHAREDEMKVSVFTGPYFTDDDPVIYGVRIPLTFWKIIAFIHDETGKLCATGYEMNQEQSLPPEEFVFGGFTSPQLGIATQLSIRSIEEKSGIAFRKLAAVDPLAGGNEGLGSDENLAPLQALEQIRFFR